MINFLSEVRVKLVHDKNIAWANYLPEDYLFVQATPELKVWRAGLDQPKDSGHLRAMRAIAELPGMS